jgi:hypothetical protein
MRSLTSFRAHLFAGFSAGCLILTLSLPVVSVALNGRSAPAGGGEGVIAGSDALPLIPSTTGSLWQITRALDLLESQHSTNELQIDIINDQYRVLLEEITLVRADVSRLSTLAREVLQDSLELLPAVDNPTPKSELTIEEKPGGRSSRPVVSGHWLTHSSGKRHNSRCRYYQRSLGRAYLADEGTACRLCGG